MKTIFITLLFLSFSGLAQQKYLTKTGSVDFEASVPSFEEVRAKNNVVTAILNVDNGEFAALALVKAFRFKNALMEEHFNENYAESHKFPKATFKGNIEGFNFKELKNENNYKISGELTFHGVTKLLNNVPVVIQKKDNEIILHGSFKLLPSDFNIKIPSIVKNKISDEVMTTFEFILTKQ
ncbi:MAG: YceI family protein [Gelidibacter sp.]|nr:YceI family protein [Gelidibacter sp.]